MLDMSPQWCPNHRVIQGSRPNAQLPSSPESRNSWPTGLLRPLRRISRGSSPARDGSQTPPFSQQPTSKSSHSLSEPLQSLPQRVNRGRPPDASALVPSYKSRIGEETSCKQGRDKNPDAQKIRKRPRERLAQCLDNPSPPVERRASQLPKLQQQQSSKRSKGQGLRITTVLGQAEPSIALLKPSATRLTTKTLPSVSSVVSPSEKDISSGLSSLKLASTCSSGHLPVPRDHSHFVTDNEHLSAKSLDDNIDSACMSECSFMTFSDADASADASDDLCARDADPEWTAVKWTLVNLLLEKYEKSQITSEDKIVSHGGSRNPETPHRSAKSSTKASRTPSANPPPNKRQRDDGDEDEEWGENGDDKRSKPNDPSSQGPNIKILACPYCKWNFDKFSPNNHREKEYRGCSSVYLTEIARLKQHLYRVHSRPQLYCPICWARFKDEEQDRFDRHIQGRSCQPNGPDPWADKMTSEQNVAIKRRRLGRTDEENWYAIFKILFGEDTPLPASIYADDVMVNLEDVIHFLHTHGLDVVRTVWETQSPSFPFVQHFSTMLGDATEHFLEGVANGFITGLSAGLREEVHGNRARSSNFSAPPIASSSTEPHLPIPSNAPELSQYPQSSPHLSPTVSRGRDDVFLTPTSSRTGRRPRRPDEPDHISTLSPSTGIQTSPVQFLGDGSSVSEGWDPLNEDPVPRAVMSLPTVNASDILQATVAQQLRGQQDYQQIGGHFGPEIPSTGPTPPLHSFADNLPHGTINPEMLQTAWYGNGPQIILNDQGNQPLQQDGAVMNWHQQVDQMSQQPSQHYDRDIHY